MVLRGEHRGKVGKVETSQMLGVQIGEEIVEVNRGYVCGYQTI